MQQEMMRIYREEKGQPDGWLLPHHGPDPRVYRLVLGTALQRGNAQCSVDTVDQRFVVTRPLLHSSFGHDRYDTAANCAQSHTARPHASQDDVVYAALIFSVMFFFFPAGLVLYWITNNILSILQQWIINTRMGVPPQFNLPKFK
jgi:YidC/Oxa1 family membrane protein insertase